MKKTIFFTDKYITFSSTPLPGYDFTLDSRIASIIKLSRAKVVDFFEKYNSILFLSTTPEEAYSTFCKEFHHVDAAGGLVQNSSNETLMIFRNGRWDLPKGHLESGETLEECAVREVCEETGIDGITIGEKIVETQHTYSLHGKWEIKTTHWYSMQCECRSTHGQSEEGIESVEWCSAEQVTKNLQSTYPTIRMVFEAKE
ncbi:MAG: NUDIX hydrolase [Rikenellaceae bacterium]